MLHNIKKRQSGFTIIEVLIVLAIAGLILLIVFLAVPNLQRSSRNTQRKNDASALGGAVANFISNNSGNVPTALGKNTANPTSAEDVCTTGGGAIGGTTACTGNLETTKLGFYDPTKVYISAAASPAVAPTVVATGSEAATKVSINSVAIIEGQDCTPTASSRTAAIYYVTESGSGNGSLQCVEQ